MHQENREITVLNNPYVCRLLSTGICVSQLEGFAPRDQMAVCAHVAGVTVALRTPTEGAQVPCVWPMSAYNSIRGAFSLDICNL